MQVIKLFLFCFVLKRGRETSTPPTGGQACNPGVCPRLGIKLANFGSQAGTQSTELHQPG